MTMTCKFCDEPAIFTMEGFMPDVPEFLVCAEHAKDGEALLSGCTFMSIGDTDRTECFIQKQTA